MLFNFYSTIWLSKKKIYKPEKIFFVETCALIFLFGTHEQPIYTFYTKYISGIKSNESFHYVKGQLEMIEE